MMEKNSARRDVSCSEIYEHDRLAPRDFDCRLAKVSIGMIGFAGALVALVL